MPVPGPRERARARREAEQLREEQDQESSDSGSSGGSGVSDGGSTSSGSTSQEGRISSPNYTDPDAGDSDSSSDDSDSIGSPGPREREQARQEAEEQMDDTDSSSGSSGGSGGSDTIGSPGPREREEARQETEEQIEDSEPETTVGSPGPRERERVANQPSEAEQQIEDKLESDLGTEVEAGQDFTTSQETFGGFAPSAQQRQRAQQLRQAGLDQEATEYLEENTAERTVTTADFTDDFQRRVATDRLERQLEEETGRDLTPGEDFSVQETDEGYEGTVEQEQTQRSEERFVEGVLSGADDILSPAVTSFEAQSGVDIPGEGPVTTTETGSPEQISEGARDITGVEDPTTAAEATDEALGQTDEQVRQQREETSQTLTGQDSPYNVVDNVAEFADLDNEALPYMEEELTDEEIRELQGVQGETVPGASSIGPGGAARGAVGASRVIGSTDDLLRGGAIVGGAAAVGAGAEEVSIPEGEQQGELEAGETAQGQTELEVTDQELSELGVGDTVVQTEVNVPEGQEATDPTTVQTGGQTFQEQGEVDQRPTVEEGDILPNQGEPEQRGPSVREQQQRDDLFAPDREFPTGEGAVVGEGQAEETRDQTDQTQEQDVSDTVETGVGQTPTVEAGPVTDVGQDQTQSPVQDTVQDTTGTQVQDTMLDQGQATTPEFGNPNVPGFGQPEAPGYATPTTTTDTPRNPPDIELPDFPGSSDDENEEPMFGVESDEIITDFSDPLTGERRRTEANPEDENLFGF